MERAVEFSARAADCHEERSILVARKSGHHGENTTVLS
jgi:hypothetical protein